MPEHYAAILPNPFMPDRAAKRSAMTAPYGTPKPAKRSPVPWIKPAAKPRKTVKHSKAR